MDTTKAFLRAKWNAPVIESGGFRQSRRLDDQLSCDGETEAYTGIVFYVEKGLSGRLSFLKQFVSNLRSIQSEIEGYFIHLLSFGFDDNVLHTLARPERVYGNRLPVSYVITTLEKLSGSEPSSNGIIPAIRDGILPRREDLCIFLCKNHLVKMSPLAYNDYTRVIQKHSLWFFIDEQDEKKQWNFGTFRPEVVNAKEVVNGQNSRPQEGF